MKINISPTTNFGAKFINNVTVQKYNPYSREYTPDTVSFVQIEPEKRRDVLAINAVTDLWSDGAFMIDIANVVDDLSIGAADSERYQVYALTSQNRDFDKLCSDDILGLAEVENGEKAVELDYLQVNPQFIFGSQCPLFREVGTGIVDSLKSLYNKVIELTSVYSATEFYEKNGFEIFDINKLRYRWKPNLK